MITLQKGQEQEFTKVNKNKESKVININKKQKSKAEQKRERNQEILNDKKLDYALELDKKQLRADKKLIKIQKDNEFKYKEVEIKCNIKSLALKAGYTLGKVCLVLTFISCLLTFGGNIANFICNIPLLEGEKAQDFMFTWKKVVDSQMITKTLQRDITEVYRFNWLTTSIYVPFLIGMQSILYQISLTIYIIKTRFKEYYKYALLLQYSMLFYSVYSNYMFISYYVKPTTIIDKAMCLIPSLLLDISCIFFLSLSMRMKTLNFDSKEMDKQQNLLLSGLTMFDEYRTNRKAKKNKNLDLNKDKDSIIDKSKNSTKRRKNLSLKLDLNSTKFSLKNKSDMDKILKVKSDKNSTKNEKSTNLENVGTTGQGNKNTGLKKDKNRNSFKGKEPTGSSSNKVKDKELKKVKDFIKELQKNKTEIVPIKELKKKCNVDKNKWLDIKKMLLKEGGYIYTKEETPRTTYVLC